MKDYYVILDISPTATGTAIKSAYRKKAAVLHPDRNPDPMAKLAFQDVQEAYDVLGDGEKRAAYDENRRRGLLDDPLEQAKTLWGRFLERIVI